EAYWQDVRSGVLRSVSIGYQVHQWQDAATNGTLRVRTAVKWTPKEISLVALPADVGATVRKDDSRMDDNNQDTDDAREARAAVHTEIRTLVKAAGLDHQVADQLVDRGASIDEAKTALFDQLRQRTAHVQHQRLDVGENHDAIEAKRERMADALESRMT